MEPGTHDPQWELEEQGQESIGKVTLTQSSPSTTDPVSYGHALRSGLSRARCDTPGDSNSVRNALLLGQASVPGQPGR